MTKWEEVGIWCGLITIMFLFIGLGVSIAILPAQQSMIETQYEVSAIDLQTLVYVNNENEIITIDWSDKTSQIKIINSNTTYLVAETTEHFTFHTLYLNVSDLGV